MAQDTQWPSEDEDFDAVLDDKQSAGNQFVGTKPKIAPAAAPAAVKKPAKTVPIAFSEPEAQPEAAAEPFDETVFDQPVQHHDAEPTAEHHDEPAAKPVAAPVVSNDAVEQPDQPEEQPAQPEHAPEQYAHVKEPKAPRNRPQNLGHIIAETILVIALLGLGYYAYVLRGDNQTLKTQVATLNANPQIAVQKQTDDIIKKVGALIQLPIGETPTIANVSDAAKAKEQSNFFAKAQNGDKVLLYAKAGQAILYRPSTNRIILQAPLSYNNDSAASAPTTGTTSTTTKR